MSRHEIKSTYHVVKREIIPLPFKQILALRKFRLNYSES